METKNRSLLFIGNHFSHTSMNPKKNESLSEELANQLVKNGWEITLTSKNTCRACRLVDMIWAVLSLSKKYDLAEVDVFSGAAFLWAFICTGLLKILSKPIILILHGGNLPQFSTKHPRQVERLLSWADEIVAPSNYLGESLSNFRSDIRIIPNGLEIQKYPFKLRENPRPNIVWLRAFHRVYNPSLAPKTMKLLKDRGLNFNLTMVGPDKGDGSLQEMIQISEELDVFENIKIIKGVSKGQVPEILNQFDIFMNTTNFDNTPVSVVEAMACGLCIVTTDVGGIPYLLKDGIEALLVPANNPEEMATALYKILTRPKLAELLSKNSRKKAEEFDWSLVLPRWEDLFKWMV